MIRFAALTLLLPCLLGGALAPAVLAVDIFSENFDGLPLGKNVDETKVGDAVWTATPPADWAKDNTQLPGGGVTEWRGWSFANREWWASAVGDQNRSQFTKGTGTVAIADPDEWDDTAHDAGLFNSFLSTPSFSLTSVLGNSLQLAFDSSWRPEGFDDGDKTNNQTATIEVAYDGGAFLPILRWDSQSGGPFFKADATNESVLINLPDATGKSNAALRFGLTKAANDWWWAVDNIKVSGQPVPEPSTAVLAGLGLIGLGVARWRRGRR